MENNKQELNYIEVLINSLSKKRDILELILAKNEDQRSVISTDEFDEEEFDRLYEEKGRLIAELNMLDSGFESVYARVKDAITSNPKEYEAYIKRLKAGIERVTSLSMEVESSEHRNKELMENATNKMRREVSDARATNKAASSYYYNMNRLNVVDPQFMDKKK